MGCAPSIHVSQAGVMYCHGSEDSHSPQTSVAPAPPGTMAVTADGGQVKSHVITSWNTKHQNGLDQVER